MRCYRCESEDLVLAALWPQDRVIYTQIQIVMRVCKNCGLEQYHMGDDESMDPIEAAEMAPSVSIPYSRFD